MARREDDEQWHDDPLVRALRAPGSDAELAREQEYVALYRARPPRAAVRRRLGRVGLGSVAAAVSIALTAGVASAYGRVLPDPVQDFAHGVLGPVGVRAHQPKQPHAPVLAPAPGATTTPTTAVTLGPGPSASPGRATSPAAGAPGTAGPGPTPTPHPGSTSTAAAGPTPTAGSPAVGKPPVRVPARVTITVRDRQVDVGATASVVGLVTADGGHRLRNRVVRLFGRTPGQQWTRLAGAKTDARGVVTLRTPALGGTTRLQLRTTGKVRSAVVRVVVRPTLTAQVTDNPGSSTVTVSARGGRTGDLVTAYRRTSSGLVRIGSARLDASGTASVAVPTPKRKTRITLVLAATEHHGRAEARTTLAAQ